MATRVAQARDVALNEMNFRGISINTAEAAITLVASDSGIMFINKNATANTNYVLPAVATSDGKWFWFLNATSSAGFRITAPTNTLVANNTVIKNYAAIAGNTVGECGIIVGDGSKYYLFELGSNAFTLA